MSDTISNLNSNGLVNAKCYAMVDVNCADVKCDDVKCADVKCTDAALDTLYRVSSQADRVWVTSSFKYAPPPANTEALLKSIACVVCQYPAYEANVHVCGAMACSTCDQRQHSCVLPTENRLTTQSRLTTEGRWMPAANIKLMSDILSDVKVVCHNTGCDFLGSRAQYIVHGDGCGYKLLTCSVCEESVQRSKIPEHEIGCSSAVCPFCLIETTSKEVKEHAKDLSKCVDSEELFRKLQHPVISSWVKNLVKEQSTEFFAQRERSMHTIIKKRKAETNIEENQADEKELIQSKKQNIADHKQTLNECMSKINGAKESVSNNTTLSKNTTLSNNHTLSNEESKISPELMNRIKNLKGGEMSSLLRSYDHRVAGSSTVMLRARIITEVANNRMVIPEESEDEESDDGNQNESNGNRNESNANQNEASNGNLTENATQPSKTKNAVVRTILPAIKDVLHNVFADNSLRTLPLGKSRVELMDFIYQRLNTSQRKVWTWVKSHSEAQQWGRDFSRGLELTPYRAEKNDVCRLQA